MIKLTKLALLAIMGFSSSSASAVELVLSAHAAEISQEMIKETISSHLPKQVVKLDGGYKIYAYLETADYQPGERLFSYSVQLHKRVVEAGTGKVYWVSTGGVRGHGVAVSGDTILANLGNDLVAGAESFKLDQM
ncbi:hypothetical protein C206_02324 [Pseudomonas putida TRO1]|uniref:Uncharacterized protein n=2 Tax=Pseudomonas putida TaxID=303 RepID=A0A1L7NPH1_PSEPU|nr:MULTISPECIES: hypothetical protein [Pseudomonas]HCF2575609.1 hypothetical protein [Pseudomonas aeruginosa]ELS0926985.1 hypothetical protein [Pseudomonas putida]ENY79393.1 hypothetical protein C206_02324 [Pseudomonas putida TRO1]MBA1319959.1 hypothetical protein [Pseudomonas monteilii]UWH25843.1 hypothetical protein KW568_30295 [Pseudomonas sp. HD6515]